MPRIRVEDTVSPEGNTSLPPLVFPVNLSAPSASPVTVRFSTRDLTAVTTFDYLAASGTLTFAPGQTRAYVYVRMRADTWDESSRQLRLELSLPEGAIAERPDLLPPVLAAEFPQGTWEGALTLTTPGPRLRLVARDLVGNTSVSARLRLPPPFMVLESDPAATLGTPSFLLHVPDGYLFNVQTSTNLQSWDNTGPSLRSSGSPIPWQPAGPPLPMGFFRLMAVEQD